MRRPLPQHCSPLRLFVRHPVGSAAALAGVGFLLWLAFGYFGVHRLVVDDRVDETSPFAIATSGQPTNDRATKDEVGPAATTVPPTEGFTAPTPAAKGEATTLPTTTARLVPRLTNRGAFVNRSHPTKGSAAVITDDTQTFLRLVEFETDNGPDLFVYLSAGVTATTRAEALDDDIVDLGRLKGNVGNQNYEIPPGTDLTRYRTVVVWCRRFGVAFGAADLAPA